MQRAREGHDRLTSDLHPGVFAGGARGTRTPDPLLANRRQHVHRRPSPQLIVLGGAPASVQIRAGCCTFPLYSSVSQALFGVDVPPPVGSRRYPGQAHGSSVGSS